MMMTTMMTMAVTITPTGIGTVKLTKTTIIVAIAATTTVITTEIGTIGDAIAGSAGGKEGIVTRC